VRRDVLLAAGFAGIVLAGTWPAAASQDPPREPDLLAALLVTAAAGVLAARRVAWVALPGSVALTAVYLLAGYPFGPVLLCVVWAMFDHARRRPPRASAPAVLAAAVVLAGAVLPRFAAQLSLPAVGLLLWASCWVVAPWSLGALLHVQRRSLAARTVLLVDRTVLEERIRIAREVHDVAGHGFAVVAMQAGMALVVLDERPDQARAALEAIRATSKDALAELRGAIEPGRPTPAADIPALVARARAGGLPVRLDCADLTAVAADRRQVAYDVVRESLTNVLRHAGAAPTTVTVTRDGGQVLVRVADEGPPTCGYTAGRGLTGMRSRVEAVGGSCTAHPGAGFTVTARIPA